MYDRILIPTDGSESAERAVEEGLRLAEVHDATVHVIYVVEPVPAGDYGMEGILDALRAEGEKATESVAERARERGLTVVTDVLPGSAYSVILDYATENDVDLIVMGTHGRTGLDRYLLGSVTEKVVRISPVPVLTLSTHEEAD